jgi:hypothetical protein
MNILDLPIELIVEILIQTASPANFFMTCRGLWFLANDKIVQTRFLKNRTRGMTESTRLSFVLRWRFCTVELVRNLVGDTRRTRSVKKKLFKLQSIPLWSCKVNRYSLIQYLVERGVDAMDPIGKPLAIAASNLSSESVLILAKYAQVTESTILLIIRGASQTSSQTSSQSSPQSSSQSSSQSSAQSNKVINHTEQKALSLLKHLIPSKVNQLQDALHLAVQLQLHNIVKFLLKYSNPNASTISLLHKLHWPC